MGKTPKNKSILMLSAFFRPNVGGVETHLNDLTEYLRNNGYKVFVIAYQPLTTNARALSIEKQENLEIHRIDWFGHNLFNKVANNFILNFIYLFPGLFFYSLFFLLKRRREIDVIHGHGLVSAAIAAMMSREFKKKSVVSLHNNYRLRDRKSFASILIPVLSRVDQILVISDDIKDDLVSVGIMPDKISMFRYWANQSIFKPKDKASCKKTLRLDNKFVALFVGRLIEEKGVRKVLEAASTMNEDVAFLFIGDGPLEGEVRSAALRQPNVVFIGRVKNENLPLYYSAADVLVFGRVDRDYLERVCVEALFCGLPIIVPKQVTSFKVTKEVAPNALNPSIGVLIEPTSRALCEQLRFFRKHAEQLQLLASSCRKYAVEHFSEKNAKPIEDAYKSS